MFGLTVIAVSFSAPNLQRCSDLGADYTIDYKQYFDKQEFVAQIKEMTKEHGVDYLLDPIY